MLGKRGLVPIFFLVCAGGAFAQPSDDVTISIAQAIGTSPQQVAEARNTGLVEQKRLERAGGATDQAGQFVQRERPSI